MSTFFCTPGVRHSCIRARMAFVFMALKDVYTKQKKAKIKKLRFFTKHYFIKKYSTNTYQFILFFKKVKHQNLILKNQIYK